jgi:hypothetical protein
MPIINAGEIGGGLPHVAGGGREEPIPEWKGLEEKGVYTLFGGEEGNELDISLQRERVWDVRSSLIPTGRIPVRQDDADSWSGTLYVPKQKRHYRLSIERLGVTLRMSMTERDVVAREPKDVEVMRGFLVRLR